MAEWKITPENEVTNYDWYFCFYPNDPADTYTLFVGDLIAGKAVHFAYQYRQYIQRTGALEYITVSVPECRTFHYDLLKKMHALKNLDVHVSTIIQDFKFEDHPVISKHKYKKVFFYPYLLELPRARNFFYRLRGVVMEGTKLVLSAKKNWTLLEAQTIAKLAGFRLCEEMAFSDHLMKFYGETVIDEFTKETDRSGTVTQVYEFII